MRGKNKTVKIKSINFILVKYKKNLGDCNVAQDYHGLVSARKAIYFEKKVKSGCAISKDAKQSSKLS